ncbi:MAG: BLUF domain-containing protein, partial [Sphingomonadaceae bacterium]|nr:BLUF domain-containing protein [Sphingomonadaceae bacterium]
MWARENLIRCVAYYGDVVDDPPRGEVERIAERARSRNAGLGITGCLFYFGRHFVQVLEGRAADVDRLYGTILSDARQPDIVGLVDTLVQARSYSGWSLKFVGTGPAAAARRRPAPPARGAIGRFDLAWSGAAAEAAVGVGQLQRAPTDLALQAARHLRVAPQQQRAWQTVERLLDAAGRMLASSPNFEGLSLEAAAAQAGVTPQSAYRYFANIDDLVRAGVRRMQAHWNARFLDFMQRQSFESEAEI